MALSTPNGSIADKIKRNAKEAREHAMQTRSEIAGNQNPGFEILKAFVSNILLDNNAEDILIEMVDDLLKQEQMALTEESKQNVRSQKLLLGMAFKEVVAYGDQQGLLYVLSDRLGYR